MMSHLMVRVTEFEIVGDYVIRVTFDDKTEQTINFEPVLEGYYLGPLRDLDLFNQVCLDPDFHTLVWPNDADFDPATLYDWNRGAGEELARRASRQQKTRLDSPSPRRMSQQALS
jgi:hypothetical protein